MIATVLLLLDSGLHTWIDADDLERVRECYWNTGEPFVRGGLANFYVKGRPEGQPTHLHRWLLAPAPELVVDHINGDGLDNRRSVNLRAVSRSVNGRNRQCLGSALGRGELPEGVPIVPLGVGPRERRRTGVAAAAPAPAEPAPTVCTSRWTAPGYYDRFDRLRKFDPDLTLEEFDACFPEALDPQDDMRRLLLHRGWTPPRGRQ